jgi:hypothetical protein
VLSRFAWNNACPGTAAMQQAAVVAYSVSQHWTALLIFQTIPTLIGI